MYKRYCELRDSKGLRDSDVAKAIGITQSTFSDWKKGKSAPNAEKQRKIATFFGVTMEYLMTGESPAPDAPESAHDGRETDLLKTFRRLDERGKRTVENAAQAALLEVTAPAQDMNDRATPPQKIDAERLNCAG